MVKKAQLESLEENLHAAYMMGKLPKEAYDKAISNIRLELEKRSRSTNKQQASQRRTFVLRAASAAVSQGTMSASEFVAFCHRVDHDSGKSVCSACTKGACWSRAKGQGGN